MIEVVGAHNTAFCYTGELEEAAAGQIKAVCDQPAFADCKIRIMPDVHAHHSGDDLIGNGHGGTNGTAHACMDIGHNADFAISKGRLITDCLDLSGSCFFQFAGKAASDIILSYDFYHRKYSFQF